MPVLNLASFVIVDVEFLILDSDPGCLTPGTRKHCVPPCSKLLVHIQLGGDSSRSASSWMLCQEEQQQEPALLHSRTTGLESQATLDKTVLCSPLQLPPHQIWVICSHSLETSFSNPQGPARAATAPVGAPHHTQHPGAWATRGRESAPSHTELNSKAARLPAAAWAQPLSNKVKLV